MLKKNWAEACKKLEASQKLDPAGGTLINLALCHEGEGKLATAWVEFGDALAQAKQDKKNNRIKIAKEHLEKLEPRLPKLTVRIEGTPPSGLRVERDGLLMNSAILGTPIPVDPGEHTIRGSAPGHLPREEKISLAEGESKTLTLQPLEAEKTPEPAPSIPEPISPPPPPPPSNRKLFGYIAGGAGVISIGFGAYFGLQTLNKKEESDRQCPTSSTCSARGVQANKDAYTFANISNIGVGIGLLGLGVGTYLLLTANPSSSSTATSYSISPLLGKENQGALIQGHF